MERKKHGSWWAPLDAQQEPRSKFEMIGGGGAHKYEDILSC